MLKTLLLIIALLTSISSYAEWDGIDYVTTMIKNNSESSKASFLITKRDYCSRSEIDQEKMAIALTNYGNCIFSGEYLQDNDVNLAELSDDQRADLIASCRTELDALNKVFDSYKFIFGTRTWFKNRYFYLIDNDTDICNTEYRSTPTDNYSTSIMRVFFL